MNFPFIIIKCTSLLHFFGFKCLFSDMNIATPAFFWLPFTWSIIFHLLILRLCLLLYLRWVSWRQNISCFLIHPVTLCLLIGELNLFTFRVIIKKWGLTADILYFVFWFLHISIVFFPPCVSVCHFSFVVFYDVLLFF